MQGPTAERYVRLLAPYEQALRQPVEPAGHRFEFVFEQVIRLMGQRSAFNDALPAPFLDVARRHSAGDPATTRHFSYDETRQFFLSDLYDYLQLHRARARRDG